MGTKLITGAGGSIGQELALQLIENSPNDLIILNDISEYNLFHIQNLLKEKNYNNFELLLGDCADIFIQNLISKKGVDQIYHSAAYKHVNLSKAMPQVYYRYNIKSFLSVLRFSKKNNTKLTLISTDKAVEPINPMGASKRCCELIAIDSTNRGHPVTIVRFGNVINSSGSVIPLFKAQIKSGGPILLTDINATRYFMSISQAVRLVLVASEMEPNTYILDMGMPVKILDVAYNVASEYGKRIVKKPTADNEISIKIIGLREGEKLEERLTYNKIVDSNSNGICIADENKKINKELINDLISKIDTNESLKIDNIDWENGDWKK
jgi:FlaA1/EpsC-like NDP-sugar epimerase|tara:strand:+ start:1499 stop:2470 length:972 start_codon:yes stop_codon:yes gene_type:complete